MASFVRERFGVFKSAMVIPFVFAGGGLTNRIFGALICFAGVVAPFKLIPVLLAEPYEVLTGLLLIPVGIYALLILIASILSSRAAEPTDAPMLAIWWTTYAIAAVEGLFYMKEIAIVGSANAINALIVFPICVCVVAYVPGLIVALIAGIFSRK